MADGASGMVPGIVLFALGILFLEYGGPIEGAPFFVCLIFLIFNVLSGWFFLGDAGSYGLGAMLVCYGLMGVSNGDVSVGFVASIMTYLVIDFLTSIICGARRGISPLLPNNGRLQSRLHRFCGPKLKSRVIPNPLTGLTIGVFSSSMCFVICLAAGVPSKVALGVLCLRFRQLTTLSRCAGWLGKYSDSRGCIIARTYQRQIDYP